MSNSLYVKAKEALLNGLINWATDTVKCILVDTNEYTVDLDNDEFLSDIPAVARVATSENFEGKTILNGVADADDIVFSTVSGEECSALVIYQHIGVEATSRLLAYIDAGPGFPITPTGEDVDVEWNSEGIFKI